jgi:alkylation response protein AidB-like acyl-CoA dehydrogenase
VRETDEQRALRTAVRGLIATHQADGGDAADGDLRLWDRLCTEIGVAGLGIPERFGGAGAGPVEVSIVAEELGRALAGTPMLGSAVLATTAVLASGDEEACARLLPGLARGSLIAALAWTTPAGRWDPAEVGCQASSAGPAGWRIDGEAQFVLDGDIATVLLVPAVAPEGIVLFAVPPGPPAVTRGARTGLDQTRRLAVVRLAAARGARIGGRAALTAASR